MGDGVAVLLLALFTANGVRREHDYHNDVHAFTRLWPDRVQSILDAVDLGERPLVSDSGEWAAPTMTAELISSPQIRAALPERQGTPQGRIDVEGMFFTAVSDQTLGIPRDGKVRTWFGFTDAIEPGAGCSTHTATGTPTLVLDTEEGSQFSVVSGSTSVTTQLVRDGLKSAERSWPISPGRVHIGTTAKDAELVVVFNTPGEYTICP
jgi:hypothetical protein